MRSPERCPTKQAAKPLRRGKGRPERPELPSHTRGKHGNQRERHRAAEKGQAHRETRYGKQLETERTTEAAAGPEKQAIRTNEQGRAKRNDQRPTTNTAEQPGGKNTRGEEQTSNRPANKKSRQVGGRGRGGKRQRRGRSVGRIRGERSANHQREETEGRGAAKGKGGTAAGEREEAKAEVTDEQVQKADGPPTTGKATGRKQGAPPRRWRSRKWRGVARKAHPNSNATGVSVKRHAAGTERAKRTPRSGACKRGGRKSAGRKGKAGKRPRKRPGYAAIKSTVGGWAPDRRTSQAAGRP